jgi:hypothetical protein
MRPVEFGEVLEPGTKLTLFSDDKPDRFFTVLDFDPDEELEPGYLQVAIGSRTDPDPVPRRGDH